MPLDNELDVEAIKTLEDAKAALIAAQESKANDNAETLKNATTALLAYSDQQQEAWKQAEAERKAHEERIEDLERNLAKSRQQNLAAKNAYRDTNEYKSFMSWYSRGEKSLTGGGLDLKELRTDVNTQGGFLVPSETDYELRKNVTEISPLRLYARNRIIGGKTMDINRRLDGLNAYFEGEGEPAQSDEQKYGSESVTVHAQTVEVVATQDMLLMSAHDMENEIVMDVGEAFAENEGRLFLLGDGNKQPKGIITDGRCDTVDTAGATVSFDDFAKITGELKRGYNPAWLMNRRTLAHLFTIKDNDSNPIWQPVGGDSRPVIYGYGYDSNAIDLDNHNDGVGSKPVIFGDYRRGYEIFDLMGTAVVRDDYTQAKRRKVVFTFYRYLTASVILPEAIKIMRVSA